MSFPGASEFIVSQGGGTMNYACLNGILRTLYVDQLGVIGNVPFNAGFPSRSIGIADPATGLPLAANVGTNGQVLPANPVGASPPTFMLLYTDKDCIDCMETTQQAILGRRDVLAVGAGSVCAGWGVYSNEPQLQFLGGGIGYSNFSPTFTDALTRFFNVSGAIATDTLFAHSQVLYHYYDEDLSELFPALWVEHKYSFQNDSSVLEKIRIKVEVTLSTGGYDLEGGEATGSYDFTGLLYAFFLDMNYYLGGAATTQHYFSGTDLDAFAVQSESGEESLGIGFYQSADNVGAECGYIEETREGVLAGAVNSIIDAAADRLIMGSDYDAENYQGTTLISSTGNWQTDSAWRIALPESDNDAFAIYVRSPALSLNSGGDSKTFTFYIFTTPFEEPPPTGTPTTRVHVHA